MDLSNRLLIFYDAFRNKNQEINIFINIFKIIIIKLKKKKKFEKIKLFSTLYF